MSRPWPEFLLQDQLRIFMHPKQLVLLRIGRGYSPAIKHRKVIPFSTSIHPEKWQTHITAIHDELKEDIWRGAKVHLVISNHYVRYTVIPWNDNLSNHEEQQAYLRHCFVLVYGETARKWDLRISKAGYKKSALASGINSKLISAIRSEFKLAGYVLQNISPHMVKTANLVQPNIEKKSLWLLSVETGRICLAMIEHGHWLKIASMTCDESLAEQVEALIQRESIIHGIDTSEWPLLCHWPESNGKALCLPGREIHMIDNSSTNHPIYGSGL